MGMAIRVETSNGKTAVIYPGKSFERNQMRNLRMRLGELVGAGYTSIVFEFSETEHVYYRLADTLARLKDIVEQRDGSLILQGMNSYLTSIFNFLGMFNCFDYTDYQTEAMH